MSLTELDKEYFLEQLFINVRSISDKEYQERVWIQGHPEGCDFDEAYMNFEENSDLIFKYSKEFKISSSQLKILKKFRAEFEDFADCHSSWPPFWINSPEWTRIRELAKEVLKAFNYQYEPKNISIFSKAKRFINKLFKIQKNDA